MIKTDITSNTFFKMLNTMTNFKNKIKNHAMEMCLYYLLCSNKSHMVCLHLVPNEK